MRPRFLGVFALLVVLASTILAPGAALADARDDARRAFRRGMDLIASGEQLAGIEALERAYELLPHPSVLYNIGVAYADLGMSRSAVDYLDRYLESGPGDSATVSRLVLVLKEKLAEEDAALRPPPLAGADPSVAAPPPAPTGSSSVDLTILMDKIDELAARLDAGEPESIESSDSSDSLDSKTSVYEEVIVSASRQTTAALDSPAPTTVITAEDIRVSGAKSIPDLLRRVPGISVMTSDAGAADIAIRGFNQRVSNKVLVLVDGRSVYMDFVGSTFFRQLSIGLPDIERIEVIRGPGATLYGASAFGGVVNIITRRPTRPSEGEVRVGGGNGGQLQGYGRFGGRRDKLAWQGSVSFDQAERFERQLGDRADYYASMEDPDLSTRFVRAHGNLSIRPEDKVHLGFSGGASYGFNSFLGLGVFREFGMRGVHSNLRADLQIGGFGLRSFWNHSNAEAGPVWQRVGDRDLLSDIETHTLDVEALYSGTEFTGALRHDLAVGGGYRLKSVDWEFLSTQQLEQHFFGFIEDRLTFRPDVSLVAGFRFDQHHLVGFTPSPRFSLLLKPTDGQLVRLSAGTAFRNPAFLESYADLLLPSGVVSGVGLHAQGNVDLRPEQIAAVQVGYSFEESPYFSFGVETYYQQVRDLIQVGGLDGGNRPPPRDGELFVSGSSQFQNDPTVYHAVGGEIELHAFPVDGLDIRASYSFSYVINQALRDAGIEDFRDRRHPEHSGYVGISYRSGVGLDVSADVQMVSPVTIPERSFDPSTGDAVLVDCSGEGYANVSARAGYRFPGDRLEVSASASNIGGFIRGGHLEHCFGARVGGRVMANAAYRF